jgi:hypothetical protein
MPDLQIKDGKVVYLDDSFPANTIYKLPTADGTTAQVIKTDGGGNLSFGDVSGTISISGSYGNSIIVNSDEDGGVSSDILHTDVANSRVGINDTTPSYTLDVNGTFRTTGNSILGDASGDSVTINAATIALANVAAGTDNTVLVYNGSSVVTDEIDSRVWGSTLVDGSGSSNNITKWSDSNTVTNSLITDDGSTVTVGGNFTVTGTTTTVNTTNTTITDNLLELNSGASSNSNDSGIIIERGSTGDNGLFIWDESADKFALGTTTGTASSTGNITYTDAGLQLSTLNISDDLVFGNRVTTDGHIQLYNGSLALGYAIGVEANTLYYRGSVNHRWYIGTLADGGTSDYMELSTTALTVNAGLNVSGNVGIGTSSPEAELHVQGPAGAGGEIYVTDGDDTGGSNSLLIQQWDGNSFVRNRKSTGGLYLGAGDGNHLSILSGGNVGIGTTSPSYKLDINDDDSTGAGLRVLGGGSGATLARFERDVGTSGMFVDINCSSGDPQIRFTEASGVDWTIGVEGNVFEIVDGSDLTGSSKFEIDSSGNATAAGSLGATGGTITAGVPDVTQGIVRIYGGATGGEGGELILYNNADDDSTYDHWRLDSDGAGQFRIGRTGLTDLTINQSGNFGIGTTSAGDKLEVGGDITLDATDANIKLKSGVGGTTGALYYTFNTDSTIYGRLDLPYDTRASVGLRLKSASSYPITIDSGNGILFQEDGTTHSAFDTAGNLGIGTTAPEAELHVQGPAGAGGEIYLTDGDDTGASNSLLLQQSGGTSYIRNRKSTGPLYLGAGDSNHLSILSGGNVGIGTTSPQTNLDVSGSGTSDICLQLRSGDVDTGTDSSQIVFSYNGSPYNSVGYAHSIRTRHNANSDDNNAIDFWLWDQGTDSSSTLGSKRVMTIEGTGRVGINDSTPSYSLDVNGTGRFVNELTLDSNLVHNRTGAGLFPGYSAGTFGAFLEDAGSAGSTLYMARTNMWSLYLATDTESNVHSDTVVQFADLNGQSGDQDNVVGNITITSSSTAYNTSSDYRLKENEVDITDGIDRIKQLKPYRFNFKRDADTTVDGFFAHEVSDVVPEAITGTKDAMRDQEYEVSPAVYEDVVHPAVEATYDEDGNELTPAVEEWTESVLVTEAVRDTRSVPNYQGIDQSKLVPLLTAALQEAITKIEENASEIATLKAQVAALTSDSPE